jgi:acyl-coenzyme A thioesterase PaaI-like protein
MSKILWRETLLLWLYTFFNIPMIFWARPKMLEISDTRAVLKIPFRRRTKNHVNSMYFGALCVGCDLAAGILAMHLIRKVGGGYVFIFKDFHAEFLKRCEGDVYFTCNEGNLIAKTIENARQTNARQNVELNVIGTVPSKFGDEPVCHFKLTLSIKQKD